MNSNEITLSHANLIIVDDNYKINQIKELIKNIIKTNVNEADFINISTLIENDNYDDIKIIKPDGKFIKKEQISELMSEYKNTSIHNLSRYYIIEYAEDLNKSAANAILKFLEEPYDNIVAILITKNISNVLETIISRCKIINLNSYVKKIYNEELVTKAIDIIELIEKYGKEAIAFLSDLYQLSSDEIKNILEIMLIIYSNIQKKIYNINLNITNTEQDKINEIMNKYNIKNIAKKINNIEECIYLLNFNVNVRIILDKLIIE